MWCCRGRGREGGVLRGCRGRWLGGGCGAAGKWRGRPITRERLGITLMLGRWGEGHVGSTVVVGRPMTEWGAHAIALCH